MASQRVTIADIANELKLSRGAVSTALTGRRNGIIVSPETRRRVRETAELMGYQLSHLRAKKPVLQRIAVFCKINQNREFASTVIDLCSLLTRQGYEVIIYTEYEQQEEYEVARQLYARCEADAAIFVGSRNESVTPHLEDMPAVVIGEVPEGARAWRVSADNYMSSRVVGEHLWSLGHRRVGMVLPSGESLLTGSERLRGLRSIWQEHGADVPEELVLRVAALPEIGNISEGISGLLANTGSSKEHLTGLFCYNDSLAAQAMQALKRIGLRIPEDISVVGFDNSSYSRILDPPLTTVRQPFEQLGALAAQLLVECAHSPGEEPRTHTVAADLVIRKSTGPARA